MLNAGDKIDFCSMATCDIRTGAKGSGTGRRCKALTLCFQILQMFYYIINHYA